jgi:hypothetical protein
MDNMDNNRSFERNEILGIETDNIMEDGFRQSTERP